MKVKKIDKASVIIFAVVFSILLLFAGTYAYWTWTSEENKNVVFNTVSIIDEDIIVYSEGDSYFVGNFQDSAKFCDEEALKTTISFYKKPSGAMIELAASIMLDINNIGTNMSSSDSLYWVLTKGDSDISCQNGVTSSSVLSYGNFYGIHSGDTITLFTNIAVTQSIQHYTIWLWLDSSGTDLSDLIGENLDTNIWVQIDELTDDGGATHIINYYNNSGALVYSDGVVDRSQYTILNNNWLTNSGTTFMGWSTSSNDATIEYYPGDTLTATSDLLLYPIWGYRAEAHNITSGQTTTLGYVPVGGSATFNLSIANWTNLSGADSIYYDANTVTIYNAYSDVYFDYN